MKVSLAQINPKLGDFEGNKTKIRTAIKRAIEDESQILILPFGALSGFPQGNLLVSEDFRNSIHSHLIELAEETKDNNLSIFSEGKEILANGEILHETNSQLTEQQYLPVPSVFQNKELNVFVNLGPKIFEKNKPEAHEIELRILANEKKAWVFDVNLAGATDELIFSGLSSIINPKGELVTRLKFCEEDFITVDIESGQIYRIEEIPSGEDVLFQAIVRGIKDYFEKNNFPSILVSVSGGIDSALVLALAVQAVGAHNVSAVYLPSRFSSNTSHEEAYQLCSNLGVSLKEIPIEPFHQQFLQELDFLNGDLWQENVQARIRGTIVMSIANSTDALVLTTGNKTEAAMGYCTLYGDMCGGFAPISDLLKTEVRALCRYINHIYGKSIIPERTITRPPSAELRENQEDEQSLPNYEFLDQVLFLHCEEGLDYHQIIQQLNRPEDVNKIFTLLYRSGYKRHQSAIGLKISRRFFGLDWHIPSSVYPWWK